MDARRAAFEEIRFRRYECKYVVSESLAREIRDCIRPFVSVDPHAMDSGDHAYDVASLYLDAPDLKLYWESREGLLSRIKLRIRYYGETNGAAAYLEIKRRHDRLVYKDRARLEKEAIASMLAGGCPDTSRLAGGEKRCYEEFLAWTARWLARPVVWVKYRREAYVGAFNDGVRVTMDRDLVCAPAGEGNGSIPDARWRPVETQDVILEMKFNEAYPDWMMRIIQRFGLERRSYSKYKYSIRRGLDDHLLPPQDLAAMSRH